MFRIEEGFGLRCGGRDEAVATADRCHLQVQVGVPGVAAFVDEDNVCLLAADDADEDVALGMGLAKVSTKTTLTVVNCFHGTPPELK